MQPAWHAQLRLQPGRRQQGLMHMCGWNMDAMTYRRQQLQRMRDELRTPGDVVHGLCLHHCAANAGAVAVSALAGSA